MQTSIKAKGLPNQDEVWQHYKGNEYEILGITCTEGNLPLIHHDYFARHVETGDPLCVYSLEGEFFLRYPGTVAIVSEKFVLYHNYEKVDGSSVVWARPLDNFLDDVLIDGELVSRFTRVYGAKEGV